MRICIDARSLRDTPTALGRYAATLVRHIADLDRQNEYIVIRRPSRHGPIADQANFREISMPYDISSPRNVLGGARVINALQADIYHTLFHFLPIGIRAGRVAITLHDFIWVDHPNLADGRRLHRWVKGTLGNIGVRRAVTAADHIIAVSDSTRQAALADHAVAADKVTTIYHGVVPEWQLGFDASETPPPVACRGRRFVFSLGNSLPYKNLPRLLRAFAAIAASEPDLILVFAGRGEGNAQLMQSAQQLGVADRIHFAGQLSDAQIRACFTHALFFAFPSLIEGFGLPVLEAMASGCPVLTSNCSSLAEIAGENAVLVDPRDVESIAAGMHKLLADPALRQRLAQRGQQRAAAFTWETSALQTIQIYNQLT
jgi:glycosyltransferase involved in cell wall biosynthesis